MEISNVPYRELKSHNDTRWTGEKSGEEPDVQKNQSEMKNIINEIKNTLYGISSRIDEAEKWINGLEDRVMDSNQAEQRKENYANWK